MGLAVALLRCLYQDLLSVTVAIDKRHGLTDGHCVHLLFPLWVIRGNSGESGVARGHFEDNADSSCD
jgi:hypothetical protein